MSIYGYRIKFVLVHSGEGNVTIPISSASTRIRSGDPTYMQVTIPDYYGQLSAINSRSDGDMYLYKKIIGTGIWRLIAWVDLENIYTYIGPNNKSITLSGHRTYSNLSPTTVTLQDYSYIGTTNKTSIRCSIINNPEPADTIIAGAYANITAEQITYTINSRQATIEITGT
ncbi:MAG: hypothetical protein ACFFDY_01265 [Candidatus Thorarchaeota archaeon]